MLPLLLKLNAGLSRQYSLCVYIGVFSCHGANNILRNGGSEVLKLVALRNVCKMLLLAMFETW